MGEQRSTAIFERRMDVLLTASIARRFYLENRSKVEIADEFGISRFKVARILETAVARGIVKIDVTVPAQIDTQLSMALQERFGLDRAVVVDIGAAAEDPVHQSKVISWLGAVAAELVSDLVEADDVLGLAWGRSVDALSDALTSLASCKVVQLTGAHPHFWNQDKAVAAVRRTARIGGGVAYSIHAPLVVPNALTASILGSQPGIAATLRQFDHVTKAVVEIGAWAPALSTVYDALSEQEREAYWRLGVRAEMSAHLFDACGNVVPTELSDRVIAVGLEQLRRIPEVIGVAGGRGKADAIRAVLSSGLLSGIVTDTSAARRILELAKAA